MKKGNLKDKVSTVCGILLVVSGALLSVVTAGVALPAVVVTGATLTASLSGGILAYLTGKNPNGSKKTVTQVEDANKGK